MKVKLKNYRTAAQMTQAELARKVGVKQPTYQRWETGTMPIPDDKLKKLAKVLDVDPEDLLGRRAVEAQFGANGPDGLRYYGEASIQFRSGGAPLLLSISETQHSHLYASLQSDMEFVEVESLQNQTVILRRKAIADLHFCSDAFDTFGPDHEFVGEQYLDFRCPDDRDWAILEALANGDPEPLRDFDEDEIERVTNYVEMTDKSREQMIAEGEATAEDLDAAVLAHAPEVDAWRARIFELATAVVYQVSGGKRRSIREFDSGDGTLYNTFYEITEEFQGGCEADSLLVFPAAGYDHSIFINKQALDFVSIPTHMWKASIEHADE